VRVTAEYPALRISRETLFRWQKAQRRHGWAGLVDRRWRGEDQQSLHEDDPFMQALLRIYLRQQRPKLVRCWEAACLLAEEQGIETRSYHQCWRAIKAMPQAPVILKREGRKAFTDK